MDTSRWDNETDVLVVGSGAAACSAAIVARSRGADVTMLEKATLFGGTTLRSGGGFWIPNNRFQKEKGIEDRKDDAVRYMARYSFPQLYNPADPRLGLPENEYDLISTYYDTASTAVNYLEEIGAVKAIQEINWTGRPQVDYMEILPENKGIRGRVLYSMGADGKMAYGGELIRQLKTWADGHGIKTLLNHRVTRIVRDQKGDVIGVEASSKDRQVRFRATKAVVFGSGGFTHNPELMLRFQRGPHFGGCASPGSTGDFVYMAGAIGAQLGNMAGAFRAEIVLEQALQDPKGVHNVFYVMGDSIFEVNRYGLRFGDEKRNYNDRAMTHFVWDPLRAEWTNMLVFMVYDQRTATLWQGFPPLPVQGTPAPHVISGNTLDELAQSIGARLAQLATRTGGFSLDAGFAANLKQTVGRFNSFASTGSDPDFHRGDFDYDREWTTFPPTVPGTKWPPEGARNYTMYPLSETGPYFAVILGAGTLDTNGGPIINRHAQVLNTEYKPIPGLYGAGDCIASPTANSYWGGGSTIGPALTFGYLAGMNAVPEPVKQGE
ncbi:MAG: FAD-dependent oxidoreductase [Dehalococcoidia bacterium]|jgi:succinate dehydrogenase/fumarate reductase flavoprotein subunit|nr:FAD-dependent oxidoreductase [Dehalococcoidia bacterium]